MRHKQHCTILGVLITLALTTPKALAANLETKTHRSVCTSPYWPLSDCDSKGNFGGYEVELFRKVAETLTITGHTEWSIGNYSFVCIENWDEMLAELLKPENQRRCDVVVAGVSATSERIAQGYKFSYPTYQAGRRIMVHSALRYDIWWWMMHLEPRLWLLFFGTSVAVGVAMLLAELPWIALWEHPQPSAAKASNLQWGTAALLVKGAPHLAPRSPGARLMMLSFAFMVLIVTNLYTAAATARLVSEGSSKLQINDMQDLTTRTTGIFVDDRKSFERFALDDLILYEWSNQEQEDEFMADLRSGRVDALVFDAPWVEFMVANQCDLFTVGNLVLPVNMGFAFPPDSSNEYLGDVDSVLSLLDDRGTLSELERDIIHPGERCPSLSSRTDTLTIRLDQVAGLWVILAACVALGFGWNLALWLVRGWHARRAAAAINAAAAASVSSKRVPERRASGDGSQSSKAAPGHNDAGGSKPLLACLTDCAPMFGPSPPGASVSDSWVPIADAATVDEAIQVVDARLRHVDNHIKHLPWVISAVMDAKLASLRHELSLMHGSATTTATQPGSGQGIVPATNIHRAQTQMVASTARTSMQTSMAGQLNSATQIGTANSNALHTSNSNSSQRGSFVGSDTNAPAAGAGGAASPLHVQLSNLSPALTATNPGSAGSGRSIHNSTVGNGTVGRSGAGNAGAVDASAAPQQPPQQQIIYDQQFLKQAAQIKAAAVAASATVAAAAAAGASAHGGAK